MKTQRNFAEFFYVVRGKLFLAGSVRKEKNVSRL